MFHYGVCRSTPLDPVLSQIDPVETIRSCFSKASFNIIQSSVATPVFGGCLCKMSAGTMIMLRVLVIYLSFSNLTSRYYLKLLYHHSNPHPFEFVINCHPTIRSYTEMKKYFLLALLGFIFLRLYGH